MTTAAKLLARKQQLLESLQGYQTGLAFLASHR